jgi:hypothetical protein
VHGKGGGVRQQRRQIGRRVAQADAQGFSVQRLHAEPRGRQPAGADRLGTVDRRQQLGVGRARGRVGAAAQAGGEILGAERIAVGPAHPGPQVEDVVQPIGAGVPALGGGGRGLAVGIEPGQALVEIAQEIGGADALGAMRIERLRLRAVAQPQHRGCLAGGDGMRRNERQQQCSQGPRGPRGERHSHVSLPGWRKDRSSKDIRCLPRREHRGSCGRGPGQDHPAAMREAPQPAR